MDRCPACNSDLIRAYGRLVSDVGSTDVYNEQAMVCINPKCGNYCGANLSQPAKVVEVRKTKEN